MTQLQAERTDCSPIDLTYAHDIVDGDMELLQEIIALFLEDYPSQLTALQQAIVVGDAVETKAKAHRLKCSLGNIGGWRAYKLAYEIELMGMQTRLEGAAERLVDLTAEIGRIVLFFERPGWVLLTQTLLACDEDQ